MILGCSFVLVLAVACLRSGRGPLLTLQVWLWHLRASFLWLRLEALPGFLLRLPRYHEVFDRVRRGAI